MPVPGGCQAAGPRRGLGARGKTCPGTGGGSPLGVTLRGGFGLPREPLALTRAGFTVKGILPQRGGGRGGSGVVHGDPGSHGTRARIAGARARQPFGAGGALKGCTVSGLILLLVGGCGVWGGGGGEFLKEGR